MKTVYCISGFIVDEFLTALSLKLCSSVKINNSLTLYLVNLYVKDSNVNEKYNAMNTSIFANRKLVLNVINE